MKKIRVKNYTMEVAPELRKMAIDIGFMGSPSPFPSNPDDVLARALRLGLAHLLVLTEEGVKWRMKNDY